jgi:chaperonin GroES
MKFRPLHDRVALKRLDNESKTAGGIIIPDTAAEKSSPWVLARVARTARLSPSS